jgi:hypothetical protein
MIYGVTNWRALYENSETRRRKNLGWVLTPNRHDSIAFGRLMARGSDGLKIFGAWMVLLQLSSRGGYEHRGILCDTDGREYTVEDMAVKTRVLVDDLKLSIPVLIDIGWLFKTNSELLTIYGGEGGISVDTAAASVEPQEKNEQTEIDPQNSWSKYKNKNKSKNNTHPEAIKGGGVLFPSHLKNKIFLSAWEMWVVHLTEKLGRVSVSQLQSHISELEKNDAPIAAERLVRAIELGFRFPANAEEAAVSVSKSAVDELAQKIENEIRIPAK